jgi:hypothetical protein
MVDQPRSRQDGRPSLVAAGEDGLNGPPRSRFLAPTAGGLDCDPIEGTPLGDGPRGPAPETSWIAIGAGSIAQA